MKHPFILFLAALTAFLCAKQRAWTIASASAGGKQQQQSKTNKGGKKEDDRSRSGAGGGGGLKFSEFFSSLLGDKANTEHQQLIDTAVSQFSSSGQQSLSTLLHNLQRSLKLKSKRATIDLSGRDIVEGHSLGNSNKENPNRRKALYELSVRSHYAGLLPDQENRKNGSTPSSMDAVVDACEYYNDGMQSSFHARDSNIMESYNEDSILSRFSHWTYRFCPKKSLSQIHLEPIAITDNNWDAKAHSDEKDSEILKLPPNSVLSDTIQFLIPAVHDLGTYLSPLSTEYEKHIIAAWGLDETQSPIQRDLVEYYVGGDVCNGSMERHSKVIYDPGCCERHHTMLEEFVQNNGPVMIRSAEEPTPCRYVLRACRTCPLEEGSAADTTDSYAESTRTLDPSDVLHLLQSLLQGNPVGDDGFPPMPPSQIEENKKLLRSMFTHAYDSYFYNAFPASELKPLTCKPGVFDLVRVPALTLIDTLDTLIILGNYTEFARSVERLRYLDDRMKHEFQLFQGGGAKRGHRNGEAGGLFSVNQNVSVFETTIRVLGGLLSAHQMALAFLANRVSKSNVWDSDGNILNSTAAGLVDQPRDCPNVGLSQKQNVCEEEMISSPWEYDGFLLDLAHDVGKRLVFAFDTETGIPYGTVNLLHGVPSGETSVASLAGAGSLSLEFELLSRLTGDRSFGEAAKSATRALWSRRSPQLNLLGKHIDVHSGEWTEIVSGVGSNSDSFYEYLIKHYLMFPEDTDFWHMFSVAYAGVQEHSRVGEWYVDVGMGQGLTGHVRYVFESLMAFFPGLQVLLGDMDPSARTANAFFSVRELLGLLPERFDFIRWTTEDSGNVHPLRPELLESCYYLHLASIGLHGSRRGPCCNTNSSHLTSNWLWAADFALRAVNQLSWTPCGFATVTDVGPKSTGRLDLFSDRQTDQPRIKARHRNEMASYFLSETIKYFFLTFDAETNILHTDNERDWIFTTEAHPIHYVDSITLDDNRIRTQLDQVRTLLNEIISNTTSSIVDNGISVGATLPLNESAMVHGEESFWLEPPLKESVSTIDASSFGIFSSEISAMNAGHSQCYRRGKVSDDRISTLCPNYHHPDLQWTHALNGESMDYTAVYRSMLTHNLPHPTDGLDQRMLTALSSACFYGTDYYASGIKEDIDVTCPVLNAQNDMDNGKMQRSESDIIPGATRYDMGGSLGAFDVRIFPGSDGFVVMHADSQVLLEVSLFYSYPQIDGRLALVVLTVPPPLQKYSSIGDKIDLTWSSLNGSWGRLSDSIGAMKDPFEDDAEPNMDGNEYQRHVVVADMLSHAFNCLIVITKRESNALKFDERDTFVANFPCSPAMFGKAALSSLVQNGGEVVEGMLIPPPVGDEVGCKSSNDVQMVNRAIPQLQDENGRLTVQLIDRGDCSFMQKTDNYGHARGIIVINTDPNELFVMSGEIPQPGERSSTELPVSVLVSGNDGASMIQILRDEQSMGNEVNVQIQLTKESDEVQFPRVLGSKQLLQVTVSRDWGVQAVSREKLGQNELQLFIVQPTIEVGG